MGFSDPATQDIAREHFNELWHPEIDITVIGQGYHYDQEGIASGILKLFANDSNRLLEVFEQAREGNPRRLDLLIHHVAELNYEATATHLLTRGDTVSVSAVDGILEAWAERDSDAAGAFVEKHKEALGQVKKD